MRRIFFVMLLASSVVSVASAGCYASEKMGKDIQDTSHDVNQGGIHMQNGALGVRRPGTTTITSAPVENPSKIEASPTAAPPAAAPNGGVQGGPGVLPPSGSEEPNELRNVPELRDIPALPDLHESRDAGVTSM